MRVRGWLVAAVAAGVVVLTACTTQALPDGPTDAELSRFYSDLSDARWQGMGFGPGVERPEIVDPQFVSSDVWARRVTGCMNDAGYPQYSEQGGGIGFTGSQETQSTEERVAFYACQELFPLEADASQIASGGQLEYIYSYYSRYLVPCLETRGYQIDDVPTHDAFLAQGNLGLWNPYWSDLSQNATTLNELQTECPPMPPGIADPYS